MLIVVVLVVDRANIQHFNPSNTAGAKKVDTHLRVGC